MNVSMRVRKVILAVILIGLLLPPFIGVNGYALQVLNLAFIYSIAALGVTIATGITGMVVLGQAAFMGFGAYTAGLIMTGLALPWWIALPVAVVATGFLGAALGLVSTRIKGHYLAITTLGLNEIFRLVVLNESWLTGGPFGLRDIPTLSLPFMGGGLSQQLYIPVFLLTVLAYAVALRIYRTAFGRQMRSIRDDDLAAESMGVNSRWVRVLSFSLCSLYGAIAGAAFVLVFGFISPNNFLVFESIKMLLMVVIGGLGSIGGTFLGALVVVGLPEALRDLQTYYLAIFGLGVVVILLTVPRGLGIIADWLLAPWLPGEEGDAIADARAEDSSSEESVEQEEKRAIAVAARLQAEREQSEAARIRPAAGPLLVVDNVSKSFGGLVALKDVSFTVNRGEILGLIGPNGSGKSTMINACSGIVGVSSGRISLDGQAISGLPAWDVHAAGVARIFQNVRVWNTMTVLENVMICHPATRRARILTGAIGTALARSDEELAREEALKALDLMGIRHLAARRASDLSFGQSRLVELARAIVSRPKLLLLDEPGAGLRGGLIMELAEILKQLRNQGMTILVVEHRVKLVVSMCDRIVVLNLGDKIAEGSAQSVARDPVVIDAYLGGKVERKRRPKIVESAT
ncbi:MULTISPECIES: branched-chain amino acid ABC transporter ATP-binding protein/permease [Rhizobium]|uniref:branched-chain amino acid ABC transporter ATP-binding protein/permease n=1 Tax=Rhizobium TaxID=379 RepID=UPI00140DC0CC|nr:MULTISPECIES: branched-chain amino acid ABC transporter ATP-binding protein/permease [Rhizobium]MDG3579414.1 branched-chain amino acid ABC transporter ATP-binding protein/permease [Rhizobium sp. YJ-22]